METPHDDNIPLTQAQPSTPVAGAFPPATPQSSAYQALPPSVAFPPAPAPPVLTPEDAWRHAYTKERTKFRVAAGTAVAALAIAGVALVWGGVQSSTTTPLNAAAAQGGAMGQFPGGGGLPGGGGAAGGSQGQLPGGMGGAGQPPGGGAGGPGQIASQLLNADGSVNTAAVAQLKADAADGYGPPVAMLARILPLEVQRGSLTQPQAQAIASALGITLSTTGTGTTGGTTGGTTSGT